MFRIFVGKVPMVGPNCNSLSEQHRLVLLEAFNDGKELLISCRVFLLSLGKFLRPVCDRSPILTYYRSHLVVAGVGVDLEFFIEIGVMKHRIVGDYCLDLLERVDGFLGPDNRSVLLLPLG